MVRTNHFIRVLMMMTAAVLATSLFAMAPSSASADPSNMPDEGTVQTNGSVYAILAVGDRVYLGGDFTTVNGQSRSRLAAIDATTGELTGWAPGANDSVRALAVSPDGASVYAGGAFTSVNGTTRNRLAAMDATTGTLTSWYPGTANSSVRAIAVSGNRVYLGGAFTTVNGQNRERLALVDGVTGALDPNWTPTADGTVRTLALSGDDSRLYAGGSFSYISGQSRPYLAALSATTGTRDDTWKPPKPNGQVFALALSGTRVYTAEGGYGGAAAAYDAAGSGARAWSRSADGDAQAVAVLGEKVYVGGHFDVFASQTRHSFAAVDAATGALDSQWTPSASPSYPGVWALTPDAARIRLYTGGDFTSISGQTHQRFAQFSESSGTPPPAEDTTPPETTIDSGPSGTTKSSSATFTFSSSESGSTFECSLDGAAFSACTSPQDYTNLSSGTKHTFQVRATDASGNTDPTPASRSWRIK